MGSRSYENQLQKALASINKAERPDFQLIRQFIKLSREARARMPEPIYRIGWEAVRRFHSKLTPDELWSLKEDVAIAALQLGHNNDAWKIIEEIARKFPDSSRATRLLGIFSEAVGNLADAESLYTREIEKNPENEVFLRRLVAAKKGQGDIAGAAETLSLYLGTHMVDSTAWEEAATMYLRLGAMTHGIFCLEELLLFHPGNLNAQLLLADALYTAGGVANWTAAKGYYSGIVEASDGSDIRPLLGLCSCDAQLRKAGGREVASSSDGGDRPDLANLAGQAVVQAYAIAGAENNLNLVKTMMKSQGIGC